MIKIQIDGHAIAAREDQTVLEAAVENGIDIPRLCHHPDLSPSGGCRLCNVEVVGSNKMQPSCTMAVSDGLEVVTESEELYNHRHSIIDMLVSDHPLDCVTCEKSGACELQRYAYKYGISETSLDFELGREEKIDDNPMLLRDNPYCILCGRCVRVCNEVVGADAIQFGNRGFTSYITTEFDVPMGDSSCVFCGSCVQVCPTAALTHKSRIGKGREWEFERTETICGYCGVGCRIEFAVNTEGTERDIAYAQGTPNAPTGRFLCSKGRYGWDYAKNKERLTTPLVRKDLAYELGLTEEAWEMPSTSPLSAKNTAEYFVPVDWDTALGIVTDKLTQAVNDGGPQAVAGLSSARCTNEENYLFQKLMRATIGTNNVDHCARLCHASTVAGLAAAFGSGAMTNSIGEIRDADCIFITGSNTSEAHPVIGYEVNRAVQSGATLIVCDPRHIPLAEKATIHLQSAPGTDIHVFLAMLHVMIRDELADIEFVRERTEDFEALAKSVAATDPQTAAEVSGVPVADIERAARLYALGERQDGVSRYGAGVEGRNDGVRGRSSILYAMGITQRSNGTDLVKTLANLAMLGGHIGKASTGVNPLRGQANVQGACDVGALPNVYPGYQKVTDEASRAKFAEAWNADRLDEQAGLTIVEMMRAADAGDVKAMFLMGENPMMSDPNIGHVEKALRSLDFLAAIDIFLSETCQLAQVVLPATSFLEKEGTFTNTERRVQALTPVLNGPGEARPDWRIVSELGRRLAGALGTPQEQWDFRSSEEIMKEITRVSPIYGGIDYARLGTEGLVWPCPDTDHPGTPILHVGEFRRGKGKFHAVAPRLPAELADEEYPYVLTTGRMLYHFHTGTMTRKSKGLSWKQKRAYVEVNEQDAEALEITDGKAVVIESRRGQIRARARVGATVPSGVVFVPFHFKEAAANLLTQDETLDPDAKIPELKICAVKVTNPAQKKQTVQEQ